MNEVICPNCDFKIDPQIYIHPSFCPKCGFKVKYYEVNYCPNCHPNGPENSCDIMSNDDKFCHTCGNKTVLYDYIIEHEN